MRDMMMTLLAVGALTMARGALAEDATPSVDQIVHQANHTAYYQGESGRATVSMVITDSQKRERQRRFVILRLDVPTTNAERADDPNGANDDEQRFYVYFQRPADVAKMVFMVHKHLNREDDRWLYLPALDLVKRIAASDKRTSFVGSDFFYEDVSGRQPDLDTHELTQTTDDYYVLKSTPKDADTVEFGYYMTWIHRKTFIPVKTEYYDKTGRKYREYTALKVETIDGFPTVTKSSMANLDTGSMTVMEYANVKYNIGIGADVFQERYLRNPPREYLR